MPQTHAGTHVVQVGRSSCNYKQEESEKAGHGVGVSGRRGRDTWKDCGFTPRSIFAALCAKKWGVALPRAPQIPVTCAQACDL